MRTLLIICMMPLMAVGIVISVIWAALEIGWIGGESIVAWAVEEFSRDE